MHAVEVSFFGLQLGRNYPKPALLSKPAGLAAGLLWCFAVFLAGAAGASAQSSAPPVNSINQIGGRIAQCWHAPQTGAPQIVEVSVRLRFSRKGAVMGEPRITYIRAATGPGSKESITASILAAVKACTPLPFTPSLGASIAGRMLAIRFRSLPLSGQQRLI